MGLTPSKRKNARNRQEALQKARRDERLGLTKKNNKKTSKKR